MNLQKIVFILFCWTLLSCNNKPIIKKRNNSISKVCIATSGCYGTCPMLSIEIDSSLIYKFYGQKYTDSIG
ncbi:MAG: DUF6438 domain-containing protein, partial [Bacteroidia bacterium]